MGCTLIDVTLILPSFIIYLIREDKQQEVRRELTDTWWPMASYLVARYFSSREGKSHMLFLKEYLVYSVNRSVNEKAT